MLSSYILVIVVSLVGLIIGMKNPSLVLLGRSKSRKKVALIYGGLLLSPFLYTGLGLEENTEGRQASAPTLAEVTTPTLTPTTTPSPVPVEPTSEVTTTPTLTPITTSSPIPEKLSLEKQWESANAWNANLCNTDKYLLSNGASIAEFTACQYIQDNLLPKESVMFATDANSEDVANEMGAEAGAKIVQWQEFNPSAIDAETCVVYKDKSVGCYQKIATEPEVIEQTTSIPPGATCSDFATQSDAQAALPNNPQLDKDGDGVACESLSSGSSGGHSYSRSRRRRR